jgi:hypothetical protein
MNISSASSGVLWSEQEDGNTVASKGEKYTDHEVKLIERSTNTVRFWSYEQNEFLLSFSQLLK